MTFLVDRAIDAGDRDSIEGRVRTANRALAVVGEHPDPLVRDEYMMVVADRLQLDSGLLRHRLAKPSGSPNSATPPPTADGLAPIPQLELTAIRLASQTDDRPRPVVARSALIRRSPCAKRCAGPPPRSHSR